MQRHPEESRAQRKRSRLGMARAVCRRRDMCERWGTEETGKRCCFVENRQVRRRRRNRPGHPRVEKKESGKGQDWRPAWKQPEESCVFLLPEEMTSPLGPIFNLQEPCGPA